MCGICGIIDWKKPERAAARQRVVQLMNAAITHRGPDDQGQYNQPQGSLAMRRLAIIDQMGGQQPVFNETGTVGIVYNGEIYNFIELRKKLKALGHQFKTDSDTEVLVHLYEEHDVAMLSLLKGMFSFCLYDSTKKNYLLARDRFGEKPLYYYHQDNIFSFSSEIKSLLENPAIPRQLNPAALPYYFRTSLVPEPITLFKGIFCLEAGHYLLITEKEVEKKSYFTPAYTSQPKLKSLESASEYIFPLLENAIKRQMVSDVPIGAFLSGGIDSSTVVALLQKHSSDRVKTFNVKFETPGYDESKVARKVANFVGTDHHELVIPEVNFTEDLFWKIIAHVGLPFRDSSAIPSYLISKEISQHVKVALSGDGGDELFGGYDLFQWYQKITDLKSVAAPIRAVTNSGLSLLQQLPVLNQLSGLRKLQRGVGTSLLDEKAIPIALNSFFSEQEIKKITNNQITTQQLNLPLLKQYPADFATWTPLRKIMYYRLKHTLPANMLIKIDRMSMANSLEVRAPFLDADLFAASVELPDELLIKDGKGKYLIRQMMKAYLPSEVFDHPKSGFNLPLFRYQNEAYQQLAQRLLFEENPLPGLIHREELKRIFELGINLKKDNARITVFQASHQLWMMMQLFGWATYFNVKTTAIV